MRRTTIIITGAFIAILVISTVALFCISKSDFVRDVTAVWKVSSELVTMDVSGYKVIKMVPDGYGANYSRNGSFDILPATDGHKVGEFRFPKDFENCLKREARGDTLLLSLSPELQTDGKAGRNTVTDFSDVRFILYADSSVNVVNGLNILMHVKKLKVDSLILVSDQIDIDSCDIRMLEINGKTVLEISNCRIDILNIDLDDVYEWPAVDCTINTVNLTGSKEVTLRKRLEGVKQLNWIPKNKQAELTIGLNSEATLIWNKK